MSQSLAVRYVSRVALYVTVEILIPAECGYAVCSFVAGNSTTHTAVKFKLSASLYTA
jgi:hypothetical protein